MALTENQVKKISLAYQANEGNAEGVAFWVNSGVNEATAASFFYAANASLQSLSGVALATKIFENLGLNAETHPGFNQEGLAFWGNLIDSGAVPKDQAGLVIANAVRDNLGLTDDTFTQHIEKIKDITPITPSGGTFMLTTGVDVADGSGSSHDGVADTFKFTNGNEKVVGDAKTLTAGDTLTDTGSGDTDILELSFELTDGMKTIGSKGVSSGATISGIEKLEIKGNNAAGVTFDNTAAITGLTTISFSGDTLGGFKFDGSKKIINGITTIEYTGVTGGSVTIDASKAKATQALTIEGSGVDASVIAGAGNDTITGQGSINAGDGNDTIVLTGAATVNAGKGNDVIDAANNVGVDVTGISIDAGSGDDVITVAAAASIDAGAGNDVIDASKYTGVDAAITIIAGDGDDIITVGGNASVETGSGKDIITTVDGYAGTLTVKNFETGDILNLTGGTGNITVGAAGYEGSTLKVGADATLNLNGSGTIDISKATIAEDAIISITATGAATITGSKLDDTISLSSAADTVVFAATATANGVDTITKFKAGSASDKDVLNVSAFLGVTAKVATGSSDTELNASGKNVIVLNSTAAEGSSSVTNLTSSGKYVVVISDGTDSNVYYYTNGSSTSMSLSALASAVTDNVATLVGVDDTSVVSLADNFVGQ